MKESEQTPPLRQRVLAYDALRVLAILVVVAVHSLMPLRGVLSERAAAMVLDEVLHFAVPLFVFISGVLVWGRYRSGPAGSFSRLMRGRIRAVGLPYLVWAFVFLGVSLLKSGDPATLLIRAPGLLLTGHVWYHLYFIPMLFGFYLLTPVAAPLVRRWPEVTVVAVYALRILAWPAASAWIKGVAPDLAWSYATHIATHLPHMVLGAWFAVRTPAPRSELQRLGPVVLAGGLAALTARAMGAFGDVPYPARGAIYPLGMAAAVVGLVLCAFLIEQPLRRFEGLVLRGAALSFGVYFIHPLVLLVLWEIVERVGLREIWLSWWAVPAAWILVSAASFAAAGWLSAGQRAAWTVGARCDVAVAPHATPPPQAPPVEGSGQSG